MPMNVTNRSDTSPKAGVDSTQATENTQNARPNAKPAAQNAADASTSRPMQQQPRSGAKPHQAQDSVKPKEQADNKPAMPTQGMAK